MYGICFVISHTVGADVCTQTRLLERIHCGGSRKEEKHHRAAAASEPNQRNSSQDSDTKHRNEERVVLPHKVTREVQLG